MKHLNLWFFICVFVFLACFIIVFVCVYVLFIYLIFKKNLIIEVIDVSGISKKYIFSKFPLTDLC